MKENPDFNSEVIGFYMEMYQRGRKDFGESLIEGLKHPLLRDKTFTAVEVSEMLESAIKRDAAETAQEILKQ